MSQATFPRPSHCWKISWRDRPITFRYNFPSLLLHCYYFTSSLEIYFFAHFTGAARWSNYPGRGIVSDAPIKGENETEKISYKTPLTSNGGVTQLWGTSSGFGLHHDSFIGRQKVAQTRDRYWFNFSMTEGFTSIGIFLKGTLHLVVSVEMVD